MTSWPVYEVSPDSSSNPTMRASVTPEARRTVVSHSGVISASVDTTVAGSSTEVTPAIGFDDVVKSVCQEPSHVNCVAQLHLTFKFPDVARRPGSERQRGSWRRDMSAGPGAKVHPTASPWQSGEAAQWGTLVSRFAVACWPSPNQEARVFVGPGHRQFVKTCT